MAALDRRRFLQVSAAALVAPGAASASVLTRWQGRAMGASASMQIAGLDHARSGRILHEVQTEIHRLERVFSLFDEESEVSRLNRTGRLRHPSGDLVEVLALCDRLNAASGGAFDPSVQPVWQRLAKNGPPGVDETVGWRHVRFDKSGVWFARPGMALTFNGVAQGYISDRIAELLRARGLTNVLVDMGEIAAIGGHPDGRAWRAAVQGPDGRVARMVSLRDRAIATSSPLGTMIGAAREVPHILDPRAPSKKPMQRLVSVSAGQAVVADGLSTALCLLDRTAAEAVVASFHGARVEVLQAI